MHKFYNKNCCGNYQLTITNVHKHVLCDDFYMDTNNYKIPSAPRVPPGQQRCLRVDPEKLTPI